MLQHKGSENLASDNPQPEGLNRITGAFPYEGTGDLQYGDYLWANKRSCTNSPHAVNPPQYATGQLRGYLMDKGGPTVPIHKLMHLPIAFVATDNLFDFSRWHVKSVTYRL